MNIHIQAETRPVWGGSMVFALILNFIWINISEVFRYFVFIMPMMRDAFPMIPDVAPMNLGVFMIWGVWDTILVATATIVPWLVLTVFGMSAKNAVLGGTGVWIGVFGILWLGIFNMNLATPTIVFTALSLAWLEMVVAALSCTAIRLASGGLCLYSPVQGLGPIARDSLDSIGEVTHLLAPNHYHNKGLREFRSLFPAAALCCTAAAMPRLAKQTDLSFVDLNAADVCLSEGATFIEHG